MPSTPPAMPASMLLRATVVATLLGALCACATRPAAPPTLYERLGGTPKLELVVARLVDRAAAGDLTGDAAPAALKRSLVQQLCQVSGGGCLQDLPAAGAAADLRINDPRFDPLVGLLREELDRAHVPPRAKDELLRVLAPLRQGAPVDARAPAIRTARRA